MWFLVREEVSLLFNSGSYGKEWWKRLISLTTPVIKSDEKTHIRRLCINSVQNVNLKELKIFCSKGGFLGWVVLLLLFMSSISIHVNFISSILAFIAITIHWNYEADIEFKSSGSVLPWIKSGQKRWKHSEYSWAVNGPWGECTGCIVGSCTLC